MIGSSSLLGMRSDAIDNVATTNANASIRRLDLFIPKTIIATHSINDVIHDFMIAKVRIKCHL